jgi:hypothetical protein
MDKSRKTCCIDANIFFDFASGDIFDALFLLPFDFHTSDIVAHEISGSYSKQQLTRSGLTILTLDESEVLEIFSLTQDHIDLSLQDVSVYFLSRKHKTMILSNDGPLRELADGSRIEYHGTLWLLEEIVRHKILPPGEAAAALRAMIQNKRWLPHADCERLIRKWESAE